MSHDFSLSHDEPSSGDWFTPPASNCFFEDQPLAAGQTKTNNQDQHEKKKQEILSHFDVFTDLDPLGNDILNSLCLVYVDSWKICSAAEIKYQNYTMRFS